MNQETATTGPVPDVVLMALMLVGVMLGGGTAIQAGATQLLVLVALLAVEAIAAAVTVELVASGLITWPATAR